MKELNEREMLMNSHATSYLVLFSAEILKYSNFTIKFLFSRNAKVYCSL
jgi:hypothetical protein